MLQDFLCLGDIEIRHHNSMTMFGDIRCRAMETHIDLLATLALLEPGSIANAGQGGI